MNAASPKRTAVDRRIRAEAAAWVARLHGPDRARELEAGFRRWLAEHPAHAAEFELATDAWNETAGVSSDAPLRVSNHEKAARRRPRYVAPVSVGLAACLLVVIWITQILGRSTVSTSIGEQRTISLGDGSRVTLNTNSRIVVQYGERTRSVTLQDGEAYFQVVHDPARPFIVRAGNKKIIDVGTSFVVRRNGVGEGSLSVTVIEGRVAVAPLDVADLLPQVRPLKVLFVSAGSRLLIRPHAPPSIEIEPAEQATAWLGGRLVFNDTALGDAAAQFNRYNQVKIILSAPQLDKIRVGGVFLTGASQSFARSVAAAHGLKLTVKDDALILEPGSGIPDGK